MKLFGKGSSQKEAKNDAASQKPKLGNGSAVSSVSKKRLMICGLVVLVIAAGIVFVLLSKKPEVDDTEAKINNEYAEIDKYLRQNNTSEALAHAKKALSYSPNNADLILYVADLSVKDNPDEAKRLYSQAFELFRGQQKPDDKGKSAEIYSAAAVLAEQAGQIDQAKQYYQRAVDAADSSTIDGKNIINHANAALKRLG